MSDWTPYERAARITWLLVGMRCELTTAEVMNLTGLSRQGALDLLDAISRCVPVYQEDQQGNYIWRVLPDSTKRPPRRDIMKS